ncbi:MAG: T9SS type A sorting domain-containing protein [Tannerella sp.]|jgi:hypothetical protein|nr:T9SS type A sorting domain-containing protein [Tannerella sp.]
MKLKNLLSIIILSASALSGVAQEGAVYLDFEKGSVLISRAFNNNEFLYPDNVSAASYGYGPTYLGSMNALQYPYYSKTFEIKKVDAENHKYTIVSEGFSSPVPFSGGYLTDATYLAFPSEGKRDGLYMWESGFARLVFLDEPNENSVFAFRQVERGTNDFVLETANGFIKIRNGVPIITNSIEDAEIFTMFKAETEGSFGEDSNLTWSYSDNRLIISGTGEIEDAETPPWNNCLSTVKEIVFKEGITSIGKAFPSLNDNVCVVIPPSVKNVNNQAFVASNLKITTNWTTAEELPKLGDNALGDVTSSTLVIPRGTKEIYEASDVWKDFKTVSEQAVTASTTSVRANKGYFNLSMAVPDDASFTAIFEVKLPEKFTLDREATVLADEFKDAGYTIKITEKSNGIYQCEISPETTQSASASCYPFREVLKVYYIVDNSLENGTYSIDIQNCTLKMPDGTEIQESAIEIPVIFNTVTHNVIIAKPQQQKIWAAGSQLFINSSKPETVNIYSITGALMKRLTVSDGTTTLALPKGMYIVKSATAVSKVIVQ